MPVGWIIRVKKKIEKRLRQTPQDSEALYEKWGDGSLRIAYNQHNLDFVSKFLNTCSRSEAKDVCKKRKFTKP